MPQLPPPVYPSRCDPPRIAPTLRDQRRHDGSDDNAGRCASWRIIQPRPGIMPLALPHPTPRPPRTALCLWGCSRARGQRDR